MAQLEAHAPFPTTDPTVTADVHVNVLPAIVEFNGRLLGSPLQITMLDAEPTGNAFTVTVCAAVAVFPLPSVTVQVTVVLPKEYVVEG